MIGKDFKESTWGKFNEILPALKDYIYFQYKKRGIKFVAYRGYNPPTCFKSLLG